MIEEPSTTSTTTTATTTEADEPAGGATPADAFAVGRRICNSMGRGVLTQVTGESEPVEIAIAYGKQIYEGPHAEEAAKGCLTALGG